jgi:hypothetical protein
MHTPKRQNALSPGSSDAIPAFLTATLANGWISVAQLEEQARGAMLLGEAQSITDSKPFKRAKKALGIRSLRVGFGAAGEWFWVVPPHPSLELLEPAESTSTKPSLTVIHAAKDKTRDCYVLREWTEGVGSLGRQATPTDIPLHRWHQFVCDCEGFLRHWAPSAAALGWDALSLFGCAPTQPLAHLQVAGLLWALRGGKLIRLYPHSAAIEISDGSHRVFNRRAIYGAQIVLPWRLQ